jgi:acyl-coenzyme A thioesterase PaaI-like protein
VLREPWVADTLPGAVAGAIADSAGGYAALTLAPEDREVVTAGYKINFLALAWGRSW